jgi:hypothetical protein
MGDSYSPLNTLLSIDQPQRKVIQATIKELYQFIRDQKRVNNDLNFQAYFSVIATVSRMNTSGRFYWWQCPSCQKSVKENLFNTKELTNEIQITGYCKNCDKYFQGPLLNYVVQLEIQDGTGHLSCAALGEHADTLLIHTDIQTLKKQSECPETANNFQKNMDEAVKKSYRCKIQAKRSKTKNKYINYAIIEVKHPNYVEVANQCSN